MELKENYPYNKPSDQQITQIEDVIKLSKELRDKVSNLIFISELTKDILFIREKSNNIKELENHFKQYLK